MSAGIRAAPRRRLSRPITLHTADGSTLDADMWVRAFGVRPHSEYLPLRVAGETSIFATGDPGDADRDVAGIASRQAELTAANIHALITGSGELAAWETFPPLIVIPLGPEGGSGFLGNGVADPRHDRADQGPRHADRQPRHALRRHA